MTTLREAAQFALDALHCPGDSELMDRVEQKLRAALAEQEQEQEPVRNEFNRVINHAIEQGIEASIFLRCWEEGDWSGCKEFDFEPNMPLYTAPEPAKPVAQEPVLVVEKEPDYWSGGHFYKGDKPHINPTKVWDLPIGTKLYTAPQPAIPQNWTPTAENINALPEPLRRYISDMETNADPAGTVRDLTIARDTIRALETSNRLLRDAAPEAPQPAKRELDLNRKLESAAGLALEVLQKHQQMKGEYPMGMLGVRAVEELKEAFREITEAHHGIGEKT